MLKSLKNEHEKVEKDHPHFDLSCFQVYQVIGEGSFGQVLLVKRRTDSQDEELIALKIVDQHKIKTVDPKLESVRNEQLILDRLSKAPKACPYIVQYKCAFEDQQSSCLGIEYCPGGELYNLIQMHKHNTGKGLGPKLAQYYGACVLLALEHLHSQQVIFKDLKSENIVISEKGEPKLTDFGMSVHNFCNCDKSFFKKSTTLCITAPEILRDQEREFDEASDWWSYGCLLYEMVTGESPFTGINPIQLKHNIMVMKPKFSKNFCP
jgi:serine/threonine protein kinase